MVKRLEKGLFSIYYCNELYWLLCGFYFHLGIVFWCNNVLDFSFRNLLSLISKVPSRGAKSGQCLKLPALTAKKIILVVLWKLYAGHPGFQRFRALSFLQPSIFLTAKPCCCFYCWRWLKKIVMADQNFSSLFIDLLVLFCLVAGRLWWWWRWLWWKRLWWRYWRWSGLSWIQRG